jgi:phospholipid:diacylglycerol acyltransferase
MANFLRQRIPGLTSPSTDTSREPSPIRAEEVKLAPVSKIKTPSDEKKIKAQHKDKKHKKRRNGLVFGLGGLFGIVVAGFFAGKSDLINIPEFSDLSMDAFMDVLPAGFVKEARDLAVGFRFLLGNRRVLI